MVSLKTRVLALAATGALAALLALPAFAQALWLGGDDDEAAVAGTVDVTVSVAPQPYNQTVNVAYDTTGVEVEGPSSVVIPAGNTSTTFGVYHGVGEPGEEIWLNMNGGNWQGWYVIYLW